MPTHEVRNVPPPWRDPDTFASDRLLQTVSYSDAEIKQLHQLGELAGSEQAQEWGRLANAHPPVLRTHDRAGRRIDQVEFHPAWHELMQIAVSHGMHATPWRDGSHLGRAVRFYLWAQVEAGHGCPISMTYAIVPALRHHPALASQYEPLLTAMAYDPGLRAPQTKSGLLAGMAMTEKQGGSRRAS